MSDMWETDSPDYNEGRLYDYADWLRSYARDNRDRLDDHADGRHGNVASVATRYVCPLGCGADFVSISERELHVLVEHGGEAA